MLASPVLAGTETLITTNTTASDQQAPSVSGDWITWEDTRDGSWDIYGYNIATGEERRITSPGAIAHDPVQSGTIVAWQDYRNGNYDIYTNDLASETETQITADPSEQSAPAIDGNRLVWQDNRNGNFDIYQYDLSSLALTLITPGAPGSDKKYPAIAGDLVVWEDYRSDTFRPDIFMNDTATGTVYNLTPGFITSGQKKPAISGTTVVWKDEQVNVNGNIWMNETALPLASRIDNGPNTAKKNRPVISGTRIVWLDTRHRSPARYDVYLNDTSSGLNTRITTDDAYIQAWSDASGYVMIGPSISGNRIVWTDSRNGNRDIFLYTDGVTETCPVAGFSASVQSGALPLDVQFTDTSTPGSTPVSHRRWEFGDGNTSTDANPLHTYEVPGTHMVRLTVDNPYCRNETPVDNAYNISIAAPPFASFTAAPVSGFSPLPVTFTDSSTGAEFWNWSFGDGEYAEDQNPLHTYLTAGTYTVLLNASNPYGFSTATTTIHALGGVQESADTDIDGITITFIAGKQHLIYNTEKLPGYTLTGPVLICTDSALAAHGWQNITFDSDDGTGFVPSGTLIEGNFSQVVFTTQEIALDGFTPETGTGCSLNYSTTLSAYPVGGSILTQAWEGALPSDLASFRTIATRSNYLGVDALAYTVKISKTHFPAGPAVFHFNVNSSWVSQVADGRDHLFLERIADDGLTGEVLAAHYTETAGDLDFFESYSPRGFSTLGVSLLSGSGNPLQLITLTVTSHVSQGTQENEPDSGGAGSGKGAGQAAVMTAVSTPTPTPAPADPGVSAKVYTNPQGVVTQETLLRSSDGRATLVLKNGIVAKDAGGRPLTEISIKATPSGSLPPVPSGPAFSFAGMAYEIGPDGATFSPPLTLTFTIPQARWGEDYVVKSFDQKSGTWQDLPMTFDAATGGVTVQVPHLCCIALFTRAGTPAATPFATSPPIAVVPQVTAEPPTSAVSIITSMTGWAAGLVLNNIGILVAIVILAIAAVLVIRSRSPGR